MSTPPIASKEGLEGGGGRLPTVGLRVVGRVALLDVLVELRLLPALALPALLGAVLAALHRAQALVDALVVVAGGSLVVGPARFPLEALKQIGDDGDTTKR